MGNIGRFIIPVFGAIGGFLFVMTLTDFEDKICVQCWPVETFLYFSYFLLFLALIVSLVGAVTGALADTAGLKGSAIGLGALLLVVGVSYGMASGEVLEYYGDVSESVVRWSGAGLYMLYILTVGAVGAIVFSAISGILKR